MPASSAHRKVYDYRLFVAHQLTTDYQIPYAREMPVSPDSMYGDDEWSYPKHTFPAGHRHETRVKFFSKHNVPGYPQFVFDPAEHAELIDQLKETLYALIYHRHLLPWRSDAIRPRTIIHEGKRLGLLFANFAAAGITSLGQLDQSKLTSVFENLDVSQRTHQIFIDYIRDMIIFSEHRLISGPLSIPNASIEALEIAKDVNATIGVPTLNEYDIAFLLGNSDEYITHVEAVANQISLYRNGHCKAAELVDWSYKHLPVKRGLADHSIVIQLEWLIKTSIYQFLVYHLGSRASEALTAEQNSIFSRVDRKQRELAFITLTIFKGSKEGTLRTYPVHPFLLRIAAAARKIAEAVGHPRDALIFCGSSPKQELVTNQLNHKLRRFAWMHGRAIKLSSHSWRFTLADIVAGSADKPFLAIQFQFGQKYLSQAVAYGMRGPQGKSIETAAITAASKSIDQFLDQCTEGIELGGEQGKAIAEAFANGATKEEVKAQMNATSVLALKIDENRFCVKQTHVKGACSAVTGDALPEIEHCRGDCAYQAQLAAIKDNWEIFILNASEYYLDEKISVFDKIYNTEKLMRDIKSWPKLRMMLDNLLRSEPALSTWFETNGF